MGYLNIDSSAVPDFTQAVISLWFRVPQASMDAALAAFVPQVFDPTTESSSPPTQLNGIIPLITFGEIFEDAYVVDQIQTTIGSVHSQLYVMNSPCSLSLLEDSTSPTIAPLPTPGAVYSLNQSFIGLDCTSLPAYLCARIQTGDYPTMSGLSQAISSQPSTTKVTLDQSSNVRDTHGNLCPDVTLMTCTTPAFQAGTDIAVLSGQSFDVTENYTDYTSVTQNSSREWFGATSPTIVITPDVWHHVLLSFDISGTVSSTGSADSGDPTLTSTCSMWVSFDDVDYNGTDMPSQVWFDLSDPTIIGPNNIVTQNAFNTFESSIGTPFSGNLVDGSGFFGTTTVSGYNDAPPSYSFTPSGLPSLKQPIGLPASAEMVDHIYKVEMAEFQMFTGVTLDTSVEANRRAFIAPDKNGKLFPVNPFAVGSLSDPTAGLDPTSFIAPTAPQKLLGKKPDIALTSSSLNWVGDVNTGTAAKVGGKFKRTGTIKPFLPNPVVGE